MSRKYPRPIPHYRPISQNAYDTFVRYIFAVVPKDNRCADMVDALDKYLDGDRDTYASHLDEHTAITFEMLRFEIDKAIERSARARRPRRRKIESETTVAESATTANALGLKAPVADAPAAEEKPVSKRKNTKKAGKPHITKTLPTSITQDIFPVTSVSEQAHKESIADSRHNPPVADSLNNLSTAGTPQIPRGADSTDETAAPPLLPRRIRRAAILALRPRHKWRKIG